MITLKDFEEIVCESLRTYRRANATLYYKDFHPDNEVEGVPQNMGVIMLKDGRKLRSTDFGDSTIDGILSNFVFKVHVKRVV